MQFVNSSSVHRFSGEAGQRALGESVQWSKDRELRKIVAAEDLISGRTQINFKEIFG
jgi:hypothetical protein